MDPLSIFVSLVSRADSLRRAARWPAASTTRTMSLVFFLSGTAGLIFEVVWFHLCGLVFGNSIWSTSIVLSSFMAGLALGGGVIARVGGRMTRFLAAYAALELIVAVSGVALTHVLPQLTATFVNIARPSIHSLAAVNLVRVIAAFAVLTIPATAMGATLPVLVGALARSRPRFGTVLGRLYGWNTFGAVVGLIAAELVLIDRFGMIGSAWVAGTLNVTAAAVALVSSRRAREHSSSPIEATPTEAPRLSGAAARILACAFLAGGSLMALEVVWFRFLSMFMVNSSLALSLMLAVVLTALALGGLLGSAWVSRRADAWTYVPAIAIAAGCVSVGLYVVFQTVTAGPWTSDPRRILWMATALTFVPSLLSGLLFTLTGDALNREISAPAAATGWLTFANTTGAMCGPIVAGFVLLPRFGTERGLFTVSLGYGLVALLALSVTWRPSSSAARLTLGAAFVAAVLLWAAVPSGLMNYTYFRRAAAFYAHDGSTIVATREGPSETILLMEQAWLDQPVYYRLVTNGFSMTGTHLAGQRYMRSFVYWPMLMGKDPPRRVLVVCYGVGVTVGAATDLESPESIDVVEISPDVIAMSDHVYPSDHQPLVDSRVRLHIEDGRQFLAATGGRFDLITGEPPPPLTPGAVNLYTREYFQLIADRLAEDGTATYWLPVAQDGAYDVAPIIRAFCDVFENCSLWNGALFDWMLVGSRGAPRTLRPDALTAYWQHPVLGPRLREIGFEMPEQIGAAFLGDALFLDTLTAGVQPLTDNYPQRLLPSRRRVLRNTAPDDHALDWFHEVIQDDGARQRFARSPFIAALWPESLKRDTLPFFREQGLINRVMSEGPHPIRDIDDLHRLLTTSTLRRLPLWMLGSHDVLQRIADSRNDGSGMVEYQTALRALAIRNYAAAASNFAAAERLGLRAPAAGPLHVYALCMASRIDEARDLAANLRPQGAAEHRFWKWMDSTFQVAPRL